MSKYKKIQEAFDTILESMLFKKDGEHIDLCERLDDLCRAIHETHTKEDVWSIGEFGECTLDELLIGCYWSLTEWHGGQNSQEYATLCNIGSIYSPKFCTGPEEGTGEETSYCLSSVYFAAKNGCQWEDERASGYSQYSGFSRKAKRTASSK